MKKNVFLSLVGVAALALCLTSCDKQSVLNTEVIQETAFVTGYVDIVKGNKFEGGMSKSLDPVPAAGAKVILEINNNEFGDGSAIGVKTYETTVGADGIYKFTVKVNPDGMAHAVTVKILAIEVSDYVWYKVTSDESTRKVSKAVFEEINVNVTISKGVDAAAPKQTLVATVLEQ